MAEKDTDTIVGLNGLPILSIIDIDTVSPPIAPTSIVQELLIVPQPLGAVMLIKAGIPPLLLELLEELDDELLELLEELDDELLELLEELDDELLELLEELDDELLELLEELDDELLELLEELDDELLELLEELDDELLASSAMPDFTESILAMYEVSCTV